MRPGDAARFGVDGCPAGVRLLGPPGSSHPHRGNLVFRCPDDGGEAILKVYRRRGSLGGELLADFSQRWIEGKRGVAAATRRATEGAALSAWRSHGFEVPRILDREPPDWIGDRPSLWLELVEGDSLRGALVDPDRAIGERELLAARLGGDCARRHRRALDAGETLLVQEHPAMQHVLVAGTRLVTFDLEQAYRPDFPLPAALAYELGSTLRSLSACGEAGADFFEAFVQAYHEPGILRDSCRLFLGTSLRWRIYRRQETARRGERSKTATMRQLARRLGL